MKRLYKYLIIAGISLVCLFAFCETRRVYERQQILEERIQELEGKLPHQDKVEYTKADLNCLAKNIYNEARGQSYIGKVAVAQVTLNRLEKNKWGNTICSVVMSKGQFSWTAEKKRKYGGEDWENSLQVARDVLDGGIRLLGMEKATYFHNNTVKPYWVNKVNYIVKIDDHTFYGKH
jgi:spore germination cell wall hydrolase CwlJ-like protein